MKNIDTTIREAVAQADVRKPASINEAANRILTEDINAGDSVAIIDDPTYSLAGQKCRVIGDSAKGSGWLDVETANGMKVPVQSSLLLKL